VRLDDGATIVVIQDGMQRFHAGERVRVLPRASGIRLEPE
jgi:outer membrane lipoprotein SlyB